MIDDTTLIRRKPDAITAEVGEESVVLNGETGMFLQLNASAATIWAKLETPMTFADLCAALLAEHEVTPEQCRADVAEFVTSLGASGLIDTGA